MKTILFILLLMSAAILYLDKLPEKQIDDWNTASEKREVPAAASMGDYCGTPRESEPPRYISESGVDGQALFKTHCASCHKASSENGTGPGMRDILHRIPGGEWKYTFVRNEDSLATLGDAYTRRIQKEYHMSVANHSFGELSNDQIDAILMYVSPAIH